MDKVLGITELLESILDHLPCKDVSRAQQVSRTWQTTIRNSIRLHKALWFARNDLPHITQSGRSVTFSNMKQPRSTTGLSALEFLEASQEADAFFIHPELEVLLEKKPNSDLFLIPEIEPFESGKIPMWMHETNLTQPPTNRAVVGWQCQHVIDDLGEDKLEKIHCPAIVKGEGAVTIADLWPELAELVDNCKSTFAFCFRS